MGNRSLDEMHSEAVQEYIAAAERRIAMQSAQIQRLRVALQKINDLVPRDNKIARIADQALNQQNGKET